MIIIRKKDRQDLAAATYHNSVGVHDGVVCIYVGLYPLRLHHVHQALRFIRLAYLKTKGDATGRGVQSGYDRWCWHVLIDAGDRGNPREFNMWEAMSAF